MNSLACLYVPDPQFSWKLPVGCEFFLASSWTGPSSQAEQAQRVLVARREAVVVPMTSSTGTVSFGISCHAVE